jgi:soluble lytic murein transglycosylase-like protein
MQKAKTHPVSGLKLALVAVVFSLAHATQTAHAQSTIAVPFAEGDPVNAVAIPALSDIATMLREQFRVARADSIKIAQAVLTEANHYAVSPVLLLAVMSVESSFDRHAVSDVGARGLMQILPAAHPHLTANVGDLSDPEINVRIGSAILRSYLDATGGDLDAALFRYSGGGRGYARRVALQMRSFDVRFHSANDRLAGTAFENAHGLNRDAPNP